MDNQNQTTDPKQALLEKLQSSNNILVTVSTNPSVDELSACLGLTLWINKIGKHGTAVFSGDIPSTIEFLQPAETLEKNTDSLRDFIIALDKSKADKLRYKVEDKVVKIFITPYRTSLSAADLEFSQGDFNVDMVIALGVSVQEDLDTAITAHGRILHDAAVATITTDATSELGSINWHDAQASSLSELIVELGNVVDRTQLDGQIATALLTGIVAETDRFSNEKTTPQTMSVSAELMSAGANQQLVASKLEEPKPEPAPEVVEDESPEVPAPEPAPEEPPKPDDGTIEIEHDEDEDQASDEPAAAADEHEESPEEPEQQPEPAPEAEAPAEDAAHDDEVPAPDNQPEQSNSDDDLPNDSSVVPGTGQSRITEPPMLGGTLTANSHSDDEVLEPSSDPLSTASSAQEPLLEHDNSANDAEQMQPAPPSWMPPQPWMSQPAASNEPSVDLPLPAPVTDQPTGSDDTPPFQLPTVEPNETLQRIEEAVDSPHLKSAAPASLDSARDEVMRAINSVPDANPAPIQALNAQTISLVPSSDEPSLPDAPVSTEPASTSFDPTAFGVINDPDFGGLPSSPAPIDQPAPDPELTTPVEQPYTMPLPQALAPPPANPVPPTSTVFDPTAPPPVPPPLMPPGFPPAQ